MVFLLFNIEVISLRVVCVSVRSWWRAVCNRIWSHPFTCAADRWAALLCMASQWALEMLWCRDSPSQLCRLPRAKALIAVCRRQDGVRGGGALDVEESCLEGSREDKMFTVSLIHVNRNGCPAWVLAAASKPRSSEKINTRLWLEVGFAEAGKPACLVMRH